MRAICTTVASRVLVAVVAVGAVVVADGCGFTFDRTLNVAPGEITGLAQRADKGGEPAPFAQVAVQGGSVVRRTFGDGTFAVKGLTEGPWLLRFSDDDDADGVTERTAFSAARIVKNGDGALTSVLLGDVGLDGTFDVSGTVLVKDGGGAVVPATEGLLARMVLTRELCVPTDPSQFSLECGADLADRISVGVEAEASVDDAGAFVLDGVGSGPVFLYALLFAPSSVQQGQGGLGPLLAVAPPLPLTGRAGDVVDDVSVTIDPVADAAANVDVTIALTPATSGDVRLLFSVPGTLPSCDSTVLAPDVVEIDVAGGGATGTLNVNAPPGILDVTACVGDATGFLSEALIVPPVDASDPAILGPILLRDPADICGDPRDCDGDGFTGLPPLVAGAPDFSTVNALWSSCAAPCAEAFGSTRITCETGGDTFDCDDDGDGQPDVTESQACYGLGLGTDLDGDGLCSGSDPFPTCAANDPVACPSGAAVSKAGAQNLLDDICQETPPIPVSTCAHWALFDADSDENFFSPQDPQSPDGTDDVEGLELDDRNQVVRFTSTVAGVVQLADHDIFLPNGNFTWTRNDIHAGFPDYEIWFKFDAAGRTLDFLVDNDTDDDTSTIETRVRTLVVPGLGNIESQGQDIGQAPSVLYEVDGDACKPNRVTYFSYDASGVANHVEIDQDADGVVDIAQDAASDGGCDGGPPCTEVLALPHADAPEHKVTVTRGADGSVLRTEVDSDGNGVFENAVDFDPNVIDRRPGFGILHRMTAQQFDGDQNGVINRTRAFAYDDAGNLVQTVVSFDFDQDGVVDQKNEQDTSPVFHAFTRTKNQGGANIDNGGVFQFTDVTTFGFLDYATPTFTFPIRFDHADDASESFTFTQVPSFADGCLDDDDQPTAPHPSRTECNTDADCGGTGHACNALAPHVDAATTEGYSLTRVCGRVRAGGGAFGASCTGASLNNDQCASGLCDDQQSGRCTQLCDVDADCDALGAPGEFLCTGTNAFGVPGKGSCNAHCASLAECAPLGNEQRTCVLETELDTGAPIGVCDGERSFTPPGVDAPNATAADCNAHLMIPSDAALHPNQCTVLCAVNTDCTFMDPLATCTQTNAVDALGAVSSQFVCVLP